MEVAMEGKRVHRPLSSPVLAALPHVRTLQCKQEKAIESLPSASLDLYMSCDEQQGVGRRGRPRRVYIAIAKQTAAAAAVHGKTGGKGGLEQETVGSGAAGHLSRVVTC
jgi:hypothetical protein